ncbi:MAG: hypothetical protein K5660_02610 [Paludibacteraceae bacterium]|nr:hypothetical protein [Paludibacteraceae bacterium]
MKKTLLLFVMGLFTLGASAQLSMSSRTGQEIIDKTDYYIVAYEGNIYQIFLQDYFKSREISVSLGSDRTQAAKTVGDILMWMKSAKAGEVNRITEANESYNFVKADGKTLLVSVGDSEYCMAAYNVLVPALKKYRRFITDATALPNTIGHITVSDLKKIQKKLSK